MQLHGKLERPGCGEQLGDLGGTERDALAKRIDGVDEVLARQLRQDWSADQINVGPAIVGKLGRERVQGEQAGDHVEVGAGSDPPGDPQHAALAVQIEPIARLDLHGGDPASLQRREPPLGRGHKFRLAGRPGSGDGGADAAAAPGDLLVRDALKPEFEFGGAVAAEHQVRVAVDQTRRDPGAMELDDLARIVVGQGGHGAEPGDAAALNRQRTVPDRPIGLACRTHGGKVRADEQPIPTHFRPHRAVTRRSLGEFRAEITVRKGRTRHCPPTAPSSARQPHLGLTHREITGANRRMADNETPGTV